MRHVAIYYRVSTERQDLASQREVVEAWLDAIPEDRKPKSIKVFQDLGISGSTTKRPDFQRLMTAAASSKIDTIIVYRLDRFSRDASTAIRTILALDESGVGFISVTQPVLNLGLDNPFRRTMLAAFAEIAQVEREMIASRVRAGLAAARKRGVKLGAPSKMNETKRTEARALRDQGLTYAAVGERLRLSTGTVFKLLNVPAPAAKAPIPRKSVWD